MRRIASLGVAAALAAVSARAAEMPRYEPAPDWVKPAPPIAPEALANTASALLVFDNQQRLGAGTVATYAESAVRIQAPELLAQLGTVALTWFPDKGDLIVHKVEIQRGAERIDLLADKERFSVLRREAGLEQQVLDGMLTATMTAQGLRVGDVLRVAFTTTHTDKALKGRVQTSAPAPTLPFRAEFARVRLSWPATDRIKLRGYPDGLKQTASDVGGIHSVEWTPPLPKPAELPDDAPRRFLKPPIVEVTSFDGWMDVSRTMEPLFATEGLIAADGPLAEEVTRIMGATPDPLRRATAALQMVQGQVRYLVLGMNGGNYVPQTPAETWRRRSGDCKAKSLLLLAMLRRMGIEAEAVLASVQDGDMLTVRLPAPAAFDHVLVRATIDGRSYWLDGTQAGAQFEDIGDTPDLRNVLPLRVGGAELMRVEMRPRARPDIVTTVHFDQRGGLDLPALFRIEMRVRGAAAGMIGAGAAQATAEQKRMAVAAMVNEAIGEAQFAEQAIAYDQGIGIATITAHGVITTPWKRERGRYELRLDRNVQQLSFEPDRSRPAWRGIPVATGSAGATQFVTMVLLPEGGKDYSLDGTPALAATLAGSAIRRSVTLNGANLRLDDHVESTGAEIAPEQVAAERSRVARAKANRLAVVAPIGVRMRWQPDRSGERAAAMSAIETVFAKAIAADPDEPTGYISRASFRAGIFDRKGALADTTKLVALRGDAATYLRRSWLHYQLRDDKAALADARQALELDPASLDAAFQVAKLAAQAGDRKGALALIQERIDQGGDNRFMAIRAKANQLAQGGDAAGAVALLDEAISERPREAQLFNQRCWLKAAHGIALDSATADCNRAMELAENPAAALDSRAMVNFKLGRLAEARADVEAALAEEPAQAGSLFLRGAIDAKAGTGDKGRADLAAARLLSSRIDDEYKIYGLLP